MIDLKLKKSIFLLFTLFFIVIAFAVLFKNEYYKFNKNKIVTQFDNYYKENIKNLKEDVAILYINDIPIKFKDFLLESQILKIQNKEKNISKKVLKNSIKNLILNSFYIDICEKDFNIDFEEEDFEEYIDIIKEQLELEEKDKNIIISTISSILLKYEKDFEKWYQYMYSNQILLENILNVEYLGKNESLLEIITKYSENYTIRFTKYFPQNIEKEPLIEDLKKLGFKFE